MTLSSLNDDDDDYNYYDDDDDDDDSSSLGQAEQGDQVQQGLRDPSMMWTENVIFIIIVNIIVTTIIMILTCIWMTTLLVPSFLWLTSSLRTT